MTIKPGNLVSVRSRTPLAALLHAAQDGLYTGSRVGFREIETEVGIAKSTVESWQNGRVTQPPITKLAKLARYLQIPADALLDAAIATPTELPGELRGGAVIDRPRSAEEIAASVDVLAGDEQHQEPKTGRGRRGKPAP